MKPWIELAVRLYPTPWRNRYGTEFRALLDDVNPGWRELFDVLKGALKMRLTNGATYIKFAAAFGLFGLVAAIATSFMVPKHYVSTAVLRISQSTGAFDPIAIAQTETEVLSRTSLSAVIQRPDLNLYPSERKNVPLEIVIDNMRKDILVEVIRREADSEAFSITFQYVDQNKSRAVVAALTDRFATDLNLKRAHQEIEIADQPHLLNAPTGPNRPFIVSIGLAIGLALGILVAIFVKHTKPAFIAAGLGICGCVIGFATSFYIPQRYVSSAVVRILPVDRMAGTSEGQAWLVKNATTVSRQTGAYPNDMAFHAVTVATASGAPSTALQIHYADSDPSKAQQKLFALINELRTQSHSSIQGTDRPVWQLHYGIIEYVDAPSLPISPVSKSRTIAPLFGLAVGLALSALILNARRASVRLAAEPHK